MLLRFHSSIAGVHLLLQYLLVLACYDLLSLSQVSELRATARSPIYDVREDLSLQTNGESGIGESVIGEVTEGTVCTGCLFPDCVKGPVPV